MGYKTQISEIERALRSITIACGVSLLAFSSCVSESEQLAAQKVAEFLQGNVYEYGNSRSAETGRGSHSTIVIKARDIKAVDASYASEKLLSSCALILVNNLAPEDISSYDQLQVVLERESGVAEKIYNLPRLVTTIQLLKGADNFFSALREGDSTKLRAVLSKETISDSTSYKVFGFMQDLVEANGPVKNITLTGFTYDRNPDSKKAMVVGWYEVGFEAAAKIFHFYISEKGKQIDSVNVFDGR